MRRLLKTHGPTAAFTKGSALQLIGGPDPANPGASFSDHKDLYIEPRSHGTKLEPAAVFAYLVQKGLFRIGAELSCPECHLATWVALDALKERVACDLCGRRFDTARQLVSGEWRYRRSGVLGYEKNVKGAVPVALTLQQLSTCLGGVYSPSIDLVPKDEGQGPRCEVDFVWVMARGYRRCVVILGECKDHQSIEEGDIENLRRVADAMPAKRLKVFILLAKLSPFTAEEIERAKTLNSKYCERTILLTARELEPYDIYDWARTNEDVDRYDHTPEGLARTTTKLYFEERGRGGGAV